VQVREVMTGQVAAVGPGTSAKHAGEVMAARGFAALPVVDDSRAVIGIVAEADVLRGRLPQDPRLHLRRADGEAGPPPLLVRGVMTRRVRTVLPTADVADVARLLVDEQLRSVPVIDGDRPVGIVSRRDVLRALVRPDDEIARDVQRLAEAYLQRFGTWTVSVCEGVVTVAPAPAADPAGPGDAAITDIAAADAAADAHAVRTLAHTVPGVVAVRWSPAADEPAPAPAAATV
jgi:CBS domain-containing protein